MKNTTLCYIEKDGAYLMMHRVKKVNDENRDKWIGIGGHIEEKESPLDCILREIREETGLTVTPEGCAYRGVVTFCSPCFETEYMHLFHTSVFSGELLPDCPEGTLEWIPKDRMLSLPMWEGDRIFLGLLDRPVPFFSLKLSYDADGVLLDHTLTFTESPAKPPLLISACLLGIPCRYDGNSRPADAETLRILKSRYTLIPVCPEQLGGLPTPRVPSEIQPETGTVLNRAGTDVTQEYGRGAENALSAAEASGARIALLKARSPSCGSGIVYDGSFSGSFRTGDGVTAALLKKHGIRVYSEEDMGELLS